MLRVIQEARPTWIVGENVAGIINLALDKVCSDLEACGYEVEPIIIPACGVDAPHRRNRVWIIARNMDHSDSRRLEGTVEEGWDCGDVKWSCSFNGKEALANSNDGQFSKCESEGKSVQMLSESSKRVCDVAHAGSIGGERLRDESRILSAFGQGGACGSENSIKGTLANSNEQRQASDAGQSPRTWKDEGEWFAESGMGRVAHGVSNRVDRIKGLGNAIVPQVAYEILKAITLL